MPSRYRGLDGCGLPPTRQRSNGGPAAISTWTVGGARVLHCALLSGRPRRSPVDVWGIGLDHIERAKSRAPELASSSRRAVSCRSSCRRAGNVHRRAAAAAASAHYPVTCRACALMRRSLLLKAAVQVSLCDAAHCRFGA